MSSGQHALAANPTPRQLASNCNHEQIEVICSKAVSFVFRRPALGLHSCLLLKSKPKKLSFVHGLSITMKGSSSRSREGLLSKPKMSGRFEEFTRSCFGQVHVGQWRRFFNAASGTVHLPPARHTSSLGFEDGIAESQREYFKDSLSYFLASCSNCYE